MPSTAVCIYSIDNSVTTGELRSVPGPRFRFRRDGALNQSIILPVALVSLIPYLKTNSRHLPAEDLVTAALKPFLTGEDDRVLIAQVCHSSYCHTPPYSVIHKHAKASLQKSTSEVNPPHLISDFAHDTAHSQNNTIDNLAFVDLGSTAAVAAVVNKSFAENGIQFGDRRLKVAPSKKPVRLRMTLSNNRFKPTKLQT